jgi:apolipoprotein N-acyltransferase
MLVQPNVSMAEKTHLDLVHLSVEERQRRILDRDVTRYAELKFLTMKGLGEAKVKPDLIVWPESALPWEFYDPKHEDFLDPILKSGSFVLITGCDDRTAAESMDRWELRNCAAMMRGSYDSFQLHAKVHLVPFGEYIPLRRQLPILEKMLGHLIPGDFTAGDSLEPLRMEGASWEVVPLICFEDTIGRVARKFVRDAPQLLVNVTNDNWFHESNESAIHALNARWRCLELRRPMVRAANTGVTCAIDTEGRVIDQLPRWKQGVLHASVSLTPGGLTFYAAHGDIVAIAAGITALLMAAALLMRRHPDS